MESSYSAIWSNGKGPPPARILSSLLIVTRETGLRSIFTPSDVEIPIEKAELGGVKHLQSRIQSDVSFGYRATAEMTALTSLTTALAP